MTRMSLFPAAQTVFEAGGVVLGSCVSLNDDVQQTHLPLSTFTSPMSANAFASSLMAIYLHVTSQRYCSPLAARVPCVMRCIVLPAYTLLTNGVHHVPCRAVVCCAYAVFMLVICYVVCAPAPWLRRMPGPVHHPSSSSVASTAQQ